MLDYPTTHATLAFAAAAGAKRTDLAGIDDAFAGKVSYRCRECLGSRQDKLEDLPLWRMVDVKLSVLPSIITGGGA
ncbi:MAG: hypothetical protein IPL70_16455 [Uliginosibacterium sp.]|nr:hypothetical protein [Uliginosibacterium sp.]